MLVNLCLLYIFQNIELEISIHGASAQTLDSTRRIVGSTYSYIHIPVAK